MTKLKLLNLLKQEMHLGILYIYIEKVYEISHGYLGKKDIPQILYFWDKENPLNDFN